MNDNVIDDFDTRYAIGSSHGKRGLMNSTGDVLIDFDFDVIERTSKPGVFRCYLDGRTYSYFVKNNYARLIL